jgi:hypothetical protein
MLQSAGVGQSPSVGLAAANDSRARVDAGWAHGRETDAQDVLATTFSQPIANCKSTGSMRSENVMGVTGAAGAQFGLIHVEVAPVVLLMHLLLLSRPEPT